MDSSTMPTSLAAAAANCRCSRVVFVGNIPFHASEKELRDACELIGPVRSLRIAADPATGRRKGGDGEPVGLDDAIHAASLVSGTPPPDSVTRYLAARSARELRQMAAALEAGGPGTLTPLKERVPGLAAAAEQVGHLLGMAAADDAAEETRNKKRAAAADSDDDRRAKLTKASRASDLLFSPRLKPSTVIVSDIV
ncbi:cleavage stimulating factor 64-like [Panicum miliaceum]|uniref:Cleavage stimulating factor 64-like n=1 Tax=Panicum miliaceum TaxID=4540 RepID=A0A3L6SGJ8_PANMI|nr:cleavage stimulating factor 64-like [Panicum miliaceum]